MKKKTIIDFILKTNKERSGSGQDLYSEFCMMRSDDEIFAEQYDDTDTDFLDWVVDCHINDLSRRKNNDHTRTN